MGTQYQYPNWNQAESWLLANTFADTDPALFNTARRLSNASDGKSDGTSEPKSSPSTVSQRKERKRHWHSKTRSGCITCKSRKVKCDETRPACLRCQTAHRVCEGYDVPKAQIFDLLPSARPRSLYLLSEEDEGIQGLEFFREKTTPILNNFSVYASEFWQYVVPQVAISEESIRYLVMAVGAQQKQNYMTGKVSTELAESPGKYYYRALRRLSDPSDPPKPVIMLMCCLLFIAMENIRSTNAGIFTHINAGLRIIREWKASRNLPGFKRTPGDDLIENFLEPFMARLESAALAVGKLPSTTGAQTPELQWKAFVVPASFPNFLAARESRYELCQWLFKQSQLHENFFDKELPAWQEIMGHWKRWRAVLRMYEQSTEGKRSLSEDWQLRMLETHYRVHVLFLEVHAEPGEMGWDRHVESCRKMVNTCARFIEEGLALNQDQKKRPAEFGVNLVSDLGSDLSVVPPLYSIVLVCRDAEIRRKCIELLKKHHHRWHSDECSAVVMCESVAKMEAQGLPENYSFDDVPESRRLRLLAASFTNPGKIGLTISRMPYTTTELVEVPYASKPPPFPGMKLYPLSEIVRLSGYQGLMRVKKTPSCSCKFYAGAPTV